MTASTVNEDLESPFVKYQYSIVLYHSFVFLYVFFLSLSTSLAANMSIDKKLIKAIEELLDKKLEPINTQFKNLAASVEEALTSLAFLNAKYEDMKKKVSDLEVETDSLKRENGILRCELFNLAVDLNTTNMALDDLEQYSRRDCLEIKGIPSSDRENTNELVMAVGEPMNVDVDISDISTSHRLPEPRQTGRPAQRPRNGVRVNTPTATIIVKFARRDIRDLFYRGRKHLYNKSVRNIGVS